MSNVALGLRPEKLKTLQRAVLFQRAAEPTVPVINRRNRHKQSKTRAVLLWFEAGDLVLTQT